MSVQRLRQRATTATTTINNNANANTKSTDNDTNKTNDTTKTNPKPTNVQSSCQPCRQQSDALNVQQLVCATSLAANAANANVFCCTICCLLQQACGVDED